MIKISGLDDLARQLDDARKAFATLDGDIAQVKFDPNDPASIEAAIQTMETAIDEKCGKYLGNPLVSNLVAQMKDTYRTEIIEKAAAARLGEQTSDE